MTYLVYKPHYIYSLFIINSSYNVLPLIMSHNSSAYNDSSQDLLLLGCLAS